MTHDDLLAALDRLAEKYRVLAALRERREELEAVGRAGFAEDELPARRAAFREVAAEFPGALRELDGLRAEALRARLADVEAERAEATADPSRTWPRRRWIAVAVDYHATLREMLAAKLWLARRIGKAGEVTDEIAAAHAADGGRFDRETLATLHHPPSGRVQPLVFAQLSARHGLPRAEIVRLLFYDVP